MDGTENDNWLPKCQLMGQVGMIMCWYYDGENGEHYGPPGTDMIRAVKAACKLVNGKTKSLKEHDWWLLMDALGSADRTPELDELHNIACLNWSRCCEEEKKARHS